MIPFLGVKDYFTKYVPEEGENEEDDKSKSMTNSEYIHDIVVNRHPRHIALTKSMAKRVSERT